MGLCPPVQADRGVRGQPRQGRGDRRARRRPAGRWGHADHGRGLLGPGPDHVLRPERRRQAGAPDPALQPDQCGAQRHEEAGGTRGAPHRLPAQRNGREDQSATRIEGAHCYSVARFDPDQRLVGADGVLTEAIRRRVIEVLNEARVFRRQQGASVVGHGAVKQAYAAHAADLRVQAAEQQGFVPFGVGVGDHNPTMTIATFDSLCRAVGKDVFALQFQVLRLGQAKAVRDGQVGKGSKLGLAQRHGFDGEGRTGGRRLDGCAAALYRFYVARLAIGGRPVGGADQAVGDAGLGGGVAGVADDVQLGLGPGAVQGPGARDRRHHVKAALGDPAGDVADGVDVLEDPVLAVEEAAVGEVPVLDPGEGHGEVGIGELVRLA
uniref:ELFV_dehydrog_N domain-containing protein n=1 Tax=Parastrongyloides trichosuri TaxID=131310 RepID=A0A0N4ZXN9_PARTI